jgi:hypothetical protein
VAVFVGVFFIVATGRGSTFDIPAQITPRLLVSVVVGHVRVGEKVISISVAVVGVTGTAAATAAAGVGGVPPVVRRTSQSNLQSRNKAPKKGLHHRRLRLRRLLRPPRIPPDKTKYAPGVVGMLLSTLLSIAQRGGHPPNFCTVRFCVATASRNGLRLARSSI